MEGIVEDTLGCIQRQGRTSNNVIFVIEKANKRDLKTLREYEKSLWILYKV